MALTKPFGTPGTGAPIVLKPGETPPFPVHAPDLADETKASIAGAAWARAQGSIKAFGQLVHEHLTGAIDLLAKPKPVVEPEPAKAEPEPAKVEADPKAVAGAKTGPAVVK